MAAGKYNFTIEQGATVDFAVQYKDSEFEPYRFIRIIKLECNLDLLLVQVPFI